MSELSEKEILKILKHVIESVDIEHMSFYEIYKDYVPLPKLNEAIQGLLDLYQKEKEKNKELEDKTKDVIEDIIDYFERVNVPDEDIEFLENKKQELLQ